MTEPKQACPQAKKVKDSSKAQAVHVSYFPQKR
jgi:hypothetical protein